MSSSLFSGPKKKAFELLSRALNSRGWELTPQFVPTLPKRTQDIIAAVRPYSMTTNERLAAVCDAVDYIETRQIPGDIVECGVWKGGSSMAIALALKAHSSFDRHLYLFDTFEGMSEPTAEDKEVSGEKSAAQLLSEADKSEMVWAYSPLDEVKKNLGSTGYPSDKVSFVVGKVEDTIPQTLPEKIAILRLDTDWYASTKHELEHLFPNLIDGGVLIIDDYGHWDGCRKAVDEYFTGSPYSPLLFRIDYSGRMAIKAKTSPS